MWYITLLKQLAKNICKEESTAAAAFIESLFLAYSSGSKAGDPELAMVFGLIKDLYRFSVANGARVVSLSEFARVSLGLAIVHIKSSEDAYIEIKDFVPLLRNKAIFNTLKIKEEIAELQVHHFWANRNPRIISTLFSQQYIGQYTSIPNKVYIQLLTRIEKETLNQLNYTVSVSISEFMDACSDLLEQIDNQFELISDLLLYILPLEQCDSAFDRLINEVRMASNLFSTIILNDICASLEGYINTGNANIDLQLHQESRHHHGKEVADILEQIKQEEFPDVASIICRLRAIRLVNPNDEIVEIFGAIYIRYEHISSRFTYFTNEMSDGHQMVM